MSIPSPASKLPTPGTKAFKSLVVDTVSSSPSSSADYVIQFFQLYEEQKGLGFLQEVNNVMDLYRTFLDSVPKGLESPSLNYYMYHYQLYMRQRFADTYLSQLRKKQTELLLLETKPNHDIKNVFELRKEVKSLENRYLEISRDIMKYSNDGITRETPKNINVTHTATVQLSDIHNKIREIKNITIESDKK